MASRSTVARVGVGIVLGLALGIVLHEATKVREVNFGAATLEDGVASSSSDSNPSSANPSSAGSYCCNQVSKLCEQR
jgi:hypothetical protein